MAEPVFAALAAALLEPGQPVPTPVRHLLDWLSLPRPEEPGPVEWHRARLFQAAAGFERLFELTAPDAPGLCAFGAEATPDGFAAAPGHGLFGVSGTGTTPLEALESCIGEGIELLSQAETEADRAQQRSEPPPGMREALPPAWREASDGWMPARRLRDGATLWLPAELCLRRPFRGTEATPPWPLSIGCGAGTSLPAAALHGLLELLERDAAALWWRGGRRPRPLALEHPAVAAATALLAGLRRGSARRRSWLLDITTEFGIPVIAAVSVAEEGNGFCCGLAARPSLTAAARSAVLELCQMELALAVVAAKRAEGGEAVLNVRDLAHQARFEGIHAARCALLHPEGAPRLPPEPPALASPAETLARLAETLGAHGFEPLLLPLTRPVFGVPVCRMLCPGLEIEPSEVIGQRLAASIAHTGGGDCQTDKIPLM